MGLVTGKACVVGALGLGTAILTAAVGTGFFSALSIAGSDKVVGAVRMGVTGRGGSMVFS